VALFDTIPLCCVECFQHEWVREYIREASSEKGDCDHCGAEDVAVLGVCSLYGPFANLLHLYTVCDYELVDRWGNAGAWTLAGEPAPRSVAPGRRPLGRYCAALREGRWWLVDPGAGSLWMPGSPPHALPLDAIGITELGDDLVLATADQRIFLLNEACGGILRSFPATVVPTCRFHHGQCAMLAAGHDWIASLDSLCGPLTVYDVEGAPLGRVSLAQALATTPGAVHTIRGAGDFLGVGHDTAITTLRVARDGCTTTPP
jgi:hypothetical protein